jgi:hypothetical protein
MSSNKYRDDAERVGEMLEPVLGGKLSAPSPVTSRYHVPWRYIDGKRADRAVRVSLNERHGHFEVVVRIAELPVSPCESRTAEIRLECEPSVFLLDDPYVAPNLKMGTRWDALPLWSLLPEATRSTIDEMLMPPGSSMILDGNQLAMEIMRFELLHQADADAGVIRELDRLLAIARVIEECWKVDPLLVGAGRSTHIRSVPASAPVSAANTPPRRRPQPPEPPPRPVKPCDPVTISTLARPARDAMLQRFASERIESFPAKNAMTDYMWIKDKVVLLPARRPSTWITGRFGDTLIALGDEPNCWYFMSADDPGFSRVLRAAKRYELATGRVLGDEPYEVIAQLTGKPASARVAGNLEVGHKLAMLGALIGDHVFVDATEIVGHHSLFAGEPRE